MGYASRVIDRVGGRRLLLGLGGLYVLVAAVFPATFLLGDRTANSVGIISVLTGAAGLALFYGGYRLPRTDIRADLYADVAEWSVRGIGAMLAILGFIQLVAGLNDVAANVLVLTSLAGLAGFGMGNHDARAKTRALVAEERRREAERYGRELERYHTIVETVNDGIYVADCDDRFTLVNGAYADMTGYDREELVGSPVSLVLDETSVTAEIRDDLEADIAGRQTYTATMRTAGGERRDIEANVARLPGTDGGPYDRVGVVRDVTERNERERRLEEQNERLDSFAGMLAHELRNPVNIGQIYSKRLPRETNPEAVGYVAEAFDRIDNMIDVMLVVTRGREAISSPSSVSLAAVAEAAWDEVATPDATLTVAVERTIRADETYVRHLFRNLFENSVEHGGSDATVTVGGLPTGFYVEDDGSGISADFRERVFETGYTTASERGGMGLGLTFVREMADVYDWTCTVTESERGGARFEFENVAVAESVAE
ncbi:PAS domain S-box protein [Haloarcula nitratireducens]|uniref:histidine kinase n=1 Tax=Haloarcula nitratireducens TaxID=2487749 RepID=A0AAW4PAC3_9EURY|nr:PAS domain S-box protein [Halomicroarcula nitratireducens]MBX0294610.1 PAS domain S-box protein [Halomicroarcula nitratireducens]